MRREYLNDMRMAVQETIRICKERRVLAAYLEREEAATVMFTFADQEKEFNRALRKEREAGMAEGWAEGEARGRAEGEARGRAEGRAEGIIATLVNLVSDKLLSVQDAARQANMSEEEFARKAGLKM